MIDTKEFPDKAGRIYPPVVEIEYGDVTLKDLEEGKKMEFEFSVSYKMDIREAKKDIELGKRRSHVQRACFEGLKKNVDYSMKISTVVNGRTISEVCQDIEEEHEILPEEAEEETEEAVGNLVSAVSALE